VNTEKEIETCLADYLYSSDIYTAHQHNHSKNLGENTARKF